MRKPDEQRRQRTSQEEPVDVGVGAEVSKDPAWTNETPDDRGVVEDVVTGARPWTVRRQELGVADVGNGLHKPPCSSQIYECSNQGAHNLYFLISMNSINTLWQPKDMEVSTNLCHEHSSGWYLHVVPQFEVLQEQQGLFHADESVYLKAHVCDWASGIQVSDDVLCNDV